jgi:hypothetical protein
MVVADFLIGVGLLVNIIGTKKIQDNTFSYEKPGEYSNQKIINELVCAFHLIRSGISVLAIGKFTQFDHANSHAKRIINWNSPYCKKLTKSF